MKDKEGKIVEDSTENGDEIQKDGKDPEEEAEFLRNELKKVISQRDTVKKDKRKLKEELNQFKEQLKGIPDKADVETMMEELKELRSFREEMQQKEEEEKLKNASEWERKQIEYEKEFNRLKHKMEQETQSLSSKLEEKESELQKKEQHISSLREAKLENEIARVAIKNKALNTNQIVRLLRGDFTYDADLDKFVYLKYNDKGKLVDEKTVDEYVSEFLSAEENENLVEASVNTEGTGTKQSELSTSSSKTHSGDDYDPKDPKLIHEAEMKRLSVEDLIETKRVRDKKMAAIKEKRSA